MVYKTKIGNLQWGNRTFIKTLYTVYTTFIYGSHSCYRKVVDKLYTLHTDLLKQILYSVHTQQKNNNFYLYESYINRYTPSIHHV